MTPLPQEILCEVKSCYFYQDGDRCSANRIYVVNNSRVSPNMEIGSIGGQHHAHSSEETACKTFKPKS